MKDRPILMSAPMVRATLNGLKTQTRRVVKPQPLWVAEPNVPFKTQDADPKGIIYCPYGQPGDRLWVRENFQPLFADGIENHRETDWKTGKGYSISYPATDGVQEFFNLDDELSSSCKPSIHMPRWASRINLEITGVRVERLQDISEADAIAEGCQAIQGCKWHTFKEADAGIPMHEHTAIDAYSALWDAINGDGSWAANPWVWVVEFKRVMS